MSEGAKPAQELICLSRVRDSYTVRLGNRLLYKRLGTASLDADDSRFCSAAVPGEDWGEIESLRICSAASELRCSEEKRNRMSARPRTNYREWPGHISAIHETFIFCVFDSG